MTLLKFYILTLCNVVICSYDIGSKIYFKINNYQPCIQLANATHQIGCTSDMKGNRGVIHLINIPDDLNWLINKGPHSPYVPLIDAPMFTEPTMKRLMESKKISGALVILKNSSVTKTHFSSSLPSDPFSPDQSCPLDNFGVYKGNNEYGGCKKVKWNKPGNGMSLVYYGIPIFALSDHIEIDRIKECAVRYNYNGTVERYPLCGIEIKDFMFAAKDTPTCKRKSEMANPIWSTYCDPLGDYNVFGTLYPMVKDLEKDDIVMVSSRLDSTGFFHDLAPGADNGVTGIVTLLAAARALGDYKRSRLMKGKEENLKPIMFTFFNGEVWDYIGSSRMVWDMENGRFPYPDERKDMFNGTIDDSTSISKINMSHIGYFLEISQLGLDHNGGMFAHSDPISQRSSIVREKVDTIMKSLRDGANISGSRFKEVNRTYKNPLPPASFQRFLRKRKDIPGVVLADHEFGFVNKYYNSRFDNGENLGIGIKRTLANDNKEMHGILPANITKLAESIANALYLLASNGVNPKEKIVVPKDLTEDLFYCLLYSANCSAYSEISDGKGSGQFAAQPYQRYVSIADQDNHITHIILRLLTYYTGEWLTNCTEKTKTQTKLPKVLSYINVQGNSSDNGSLICVKGTVYMTVAVSPAFELKDFTSTEYSTWTESMWGSDMGIRMYLIADPTVEGIVLACGIIMFICSFGLVFFFKRKAAILFTPATTPVIEIHS